VDGEAEAVAEFLEQSADELLARLAEPDVTRTAAELARAWSGADLAARVDATTPTTDPHDVDPAVLLTIATATVPSHCP
jgi:hypothetical protein